MSFEFRQLRPFDIFPEFHVFPRIVLLAGIIVWIIGLFQAVSFHNPTVVLGTALILFAASCQYFARNQGMSGFWCGLLALLSFLWFVQVSYADLAPFWVKAFWRGLASLIW